jgi:hypothetical protein
MMDRKPDEEIILFVRDEHTGRFLFNDRAVQALGLDPIQLHQRGYPVSGPKTSAPWSNENPPPDSGAHDYASPKNPNSPAMVRHRQDRW